MKKRFLIFFLLISSSIVFGQADPNDLRVNQVTNFRATSNGSTITLMWDWPSSIPITGVRVYRSLTGGEPWVRPSGGKTTTPDARSFTDTGGPDGYDLVPNTDYYYAIEPYNGETRGLLSTFIKIRLGDSVNGFPDDHEGPTDPTATRSGNNVVVGWDWDPAGLTIQGFKLERRQDYGNWEGDEWTPDRKISNPNARSFTDLNVGPGVYVYRIFAFNGGTNYTFSENVIIEVTDGTTNSLSVSPSNRNVSSSSGSTTFDVTSNVSWTVSESEGWLSVNPTSGSNNGSFTVNYDANGTTSERVGTITVSGGGITRNVTVTQEGEAANQLSVSPSNRDVSSSSGSTTFDVTSNVSWTVSESEEWLSVTPTSGSNNGSFTVNYDANGTTSERVGTITVSGGGITRNVTVTQAGESANQLSVSPSNRNVSSSSGSTTFDVTSNVSWTVSESEGWLSVNPTSGSNNGSFTVNYDANGTTSERVGTITVSGGGITRNVTVTQAGENANQLSVSPSNRDVSSSSGSTTFDVTSNVSWTVSESEGWLSANPTSGSNNGSFTVNYDANGTTSQRVGTVTVSGGGITRNVTVTQDPGTVNQLSVSPIERSVISSAGSTTFAVTSNVSWTVSESAGWLSVNPSSGSNNGSVTVNYDANSTTSDRSATISIVGGGISRSVKIIQDEIDHDVLNDIRVNQPSNFTVTSSGNSATLTWEWNSNATISGFKIYRSLTGQEPWVRPSGGKIFDPDARSFVDDGDNLQAGTKYHYLVQAFLEPPGFNSLLSQEGRIVIGNGEPSGFVPGPENVTGILSNGLMTINWEFDSDTYTVSGFKLERRFNYGEWTKPVNTPISNPSARSYTDEADLPDGIYVYRVFAYSAGGNYSFSANVIIDKKEITEQLDVTPDNQNVSNSSGSTTFDVISNLEWSVSENETWLSVTPTSGLNDSTITVEFDENTSNEQRIGSIEVSGGGISRTITITQDIAVGVEDLESLNEVPTEYTVLNNYPNPFNPSTLISFEIPEESNSQLKVYDLLGKEVAVLLDNQFTPAGRYSLEFKADNLPTGIYLYVFSSQSNISGKTFKEVRKMMLLK